MTTSIVVSQKTDTGNEKLKVKNNVTKNGKLNLETEER